MTTLRIVVNVLLAGTVARALHTRYAYSYWSVILLPMAFMIAFRCYRILVYQRFLNPLSKVPGPKVGAF